MSWRGGSFKWTESACGSRDFVAALGWGWRAMKWVMAFGAVCLLVFLGSRLIGNAREVNAIAGSSEERIRGVADVLTEASGQAQGYEQADAHTHQEAQWLLRANAACVSRERRLRSIGTPRSVEEIAAYLRKALPVVRHHHARFAKSQAPATFEAQVREVRRLFAAQERTLARTLTAARRHDSSAVLAQVDELRQLARPHNAILVRLGLIDCTLPSGGFPL
jgi:hypothetical protein